MINLTEYIKDIQKKDTLYGKKAKEREDILTKPQGSLGRLEELAIDIASMKREAIPQIKRKVIFTLAGDHGVVEEGVSAFPQEVTPQMVYNFINQGAAINILARHTGSEMIISDFGVKEQLNIISELFRDLKINKGTQNFTKGPAMSKEEAIQSVVQGIKLFEEEFKKQRIDIVGIGEMGIGNTTPATAILAVISGEEVESITGRGTGLNDEGLSKKIDAIKRGLARNKPTKPFFTKAWIS
jgi:nicotinate-nucleotide--dimethylbenzimidazole phosphoribosyltransferase